MPGSGESAYQPLMPISGRWAYVKVAPMSFGNEFKGSWHARTR